MTNFYIDRNFALVIVGIEQNVENDFQLVFLQLTNKVGIHS